MKSKESTSIWLTPRLVMATTKGNNKEKLKRVAQNFYLAQTAKGLPVLEQFSGNMVIANFFVLGRRRNCICLCGYSSIIRDISLTQDSHSPEKLDLLVELVTWLDVCVFFRQKIRIMSINIAFTWSSWIFSFSFVSISVFAFLTSAATTSGSRFFYLCLRVYRSSHSFSLSLQPVL